MNHGLPRNPLELHEISLDLEELTAIGQAPIILLLLNLRFLECVVPFGRSGWHGYGVGSALALARAVRALTPLEGIAPEDLDRMTAVLDAVDGYEVSELPGSGDWPAARSEARVLLAGARTRLQRILEAPDPRTATEDSSGAILVPVIARLRSGRPVHPSLAGTEAGQILRLRIEAEPVSRRRRGGEDPILEGLAGEDVRRAFRSALAHLSSFGSPGAPDPERCWFRVRWEPPNGHLVGRSATLPFLVGAAVARAVLAPGWSVRETVGGIAATGDIDGTTVRPVASESLSLKVRACFYSPARRLLIPFEQRLEGQDALAQLEASHPNRQLLLQGIRDAREAWSDPGTVATRARTARQTCSVSFRRLVGSITIAASMPILAVILIVLIAFLLVWTRYDPVVVEWTKERDTLLVRNSHGWILRRLPIAQVEPITGPRPKWGHVQLLVDVDGNGVREVMAVHDGREIKNEWLSVFAKNGRALWSARADEIAEGLDVTGEDLHWHSFLPIGPALDHPASILVARRSRLGNLTIVERRDSRTGRVLGMLGNRGHLEYLVPIDLDGDGIEEICGIGMDNPSAAGLLVVFDVGRLALRAPASGAVEEIPLMTDPEALEAGVLTALRFPKLRFGFEPRPGARGACRQADGMIEVDVAEGVYEMIYSLRFPSLDRPLVEGMIFSDISRSRLAEMSGGGIGRHEIDDEEKRLGGAATILTPAGWVSCGIAATVSNVSETAGGGH